MISSIDLNSVKNELTKGEQISSNRLSSWLGRSVEGVKSDGAAGLFSLQDKRMAAVSLVALNVILIESVIYLAPRLVDLFFSVSDDESDKLQDILAVTVIGIGVTVFSKCTKLPLHPLMIATISLGTFFVYPKLRG